MSSDINSSLPLRIVLKISFFFLKCAYTALDFSINAFSPEIYKIKAGNYLTKMIFIQIYLVVERYICLCVSLSLLIIYQQIFDKHLLHSMICWILWRKTKVFQTAFLRFTSLQSDGGRSGTIWRWVRGVDNKRIQVTC